MVGATSCAKWKFRPGSWPSARASYSSRAQVWVVAVSLHPIRQLSPRRVEVEQRSVIDEIVATENAQMQIVNRLAYDVD